ncbi:MAG: pyridoxal-phosphate dependent enzyme [Phycisphaerales bacterium]|nr:pyridoxal-phosphate dependent enzyme [Phycisphaerales bacterium]
MAIISWVDEQKIRVEELKGFAGGDVRVAVSMLRLDKIHPIISGNKWFKLKHHVASAIAAQKSTLLSFGGAYSNHLIATAAAAHSIGLSSVAIVRGLQASSSLNSVLKQCQAYGMQLHFVSREAYAQKEASDFLQGLQKQYPDAYIIPEGGANNDGQRGAASIAQYIPSYYTHIALSIGTGTTFIGLRNVLPICQFLFGFAPMKGGIYLQNSIASALLPEQNHQWSVTDRFHFGGFGKKTMEMDAFISDFALQYNILLDRVYTAKMMMGIETLIHEDTFEKGSKILCIHTGGLTGN